MLRTVGGPPLHGRRLEIADAAIAILAEHGSRGLTHRAVDRHLEIAEGSTSSYYRTRDALLMAAVVRVVDLSADLAAGLRPPAPGETADVIAAMIERSTASRSRAVHIARYELFNEAARRPAIAHAFLELRHRHLEHAERLLADTGCPDPAARAPALSVLINGLILERIVNGRRFMSRDDVRREIGHFLAD